MPRANVALERIAILIGIPGRQERTNDPALQMSTLRCQRWTDSFKRSTDLKACTVPPLAWSKSSFQSQETGQLPGYHKGKNTASQETFFSWSPASASLLMGTGCRQAGGRSRSQKRNREAAPPSPPPRSDMVTQQARVCILALFCLCPAWQSLATKHLVLISFNWC